MQTSQIDRKPNASLSIGLDEHRRGGRRPLVRPDHQRQLRSQPERAKPDLLARLQQQHRLHSGALRRSPYTYPVRDNICWTQQSLPSSEVRGLDPIIVHILNSTIFIEIKKIFPGCTAEREPQRPVHPNRRHVDPRRPVRGGILHPEVRAHFVLISVTRWLNFLHNNWPLTTMKFAQSHHHLTKDG